MWIRSRAGGIAAGVYMVALGAAAWIIPEISEDPISRAFLWELISLPGSVLGPAVVRGSSGFYLGILFNAAVLYLLAAYLAMRIREGRVDSGE